jgi:cell division protein FtsI/penicillin-binding protein 2
MRWRGKKKNDKNVRKKNNRPALIMAVFFIFACAIIYRLYDLQFSKAEYYTMLAAKQQQVNSKLMAKRGKVFIQDGTSADKQELYPFATNKLFASVFVIPNSIVEPEKVAESLYETFDRVKIEAEVDRLLAEDPALVDASAEFKSIKRELEIRPRKEKKISEYLAIAQKKGDPYEPIADKVDEETAKKLKDLKLDGLDYILTEERYYPEKSIGAHLLGFVGYVQDEKSGRYGLEGFFERELAGLDGRIMADRISSGDLLAAEGDNYIKAEDGSDLILTINRSIQYETCKRLNEAVAKHGADGGSVIILDPRSGEVIAMCSTPDFDPNDFAKTLNMQTFNNPAIFADYEPGSTFKSIAMAAALDQNKVSPSTTYDDKGSVMIEGWPKPIKNADFDTAGGHGRTDMKTVLQLSLNTGAIFAMQQAGAKTFADYVKKFGFGERTGIELETESTGDIANLISDKIRPVTAATASFGQGITVTPLQLTVAYAAIANGGILMKPYLVKEMIDPAKKDEPMQTTSKQVRRVISARTATLLSGMLVNAVENGHAWRAKVPGYYVAGKTGTAQVASSECKGYSQKTIHSFIGFTPVNDPRFVMLTRLDDPKDSKFAESSAVPLFGEIAKFVLNYYQIPTERKD